MLYPFEASFQTNTEASGEKFNCDLKTNGGHLHNESAYFAASPSPPSPLPQGLPLLVPIIC